MYWLADEVEVEVEAASVIDVTASVIMIAVIEIETATEIVIETVIAVETKSTRMKAIATVITIVIEMPTATTIEIVIEIENEVANMIATESETDTATSVTTTETATVIVIIRVGTERTLVEATDIDHTTRGWLIGWLRTMMQSISTRWHTHRSMHVGVGRTSTTTDQRRLAWEPTRCLSILQLQRTSALPKRVPSRWHPSLGSSSSRFAWLVLLGC